MVRTSRIILIMLVVLAAPVLLHAQITWYVDDDCTPPGSGAELNPFCTIQQGVDAAFDDDTVLVGPGTYTGDGNRDISLFGKRITLKSMEGPGATTIDIQGGPTAIHRGFFLVHRESRETVIEGFSIENGYLIGDTGGQGTGTPGGGGAAIFLRDSSPTIRRCILTNNVSERTENPFIADGLGGSIYVDGGSHAAIQDCIISDNYAGHSGGDMYLGFEETSVAIIDCLITQNSSRFGGGGIHSTFGGTMISNTTIVSNTGGTGGGLHIEGSEAFLHNCIVWGNEAILGPQIYVDGFSVLLNPA